MLEGESARLIYQLETIAANAWPAAEVAPLDGWRLRHTAGVTRRANSVWPNDLQSRRRLDEKLAEVEAFYTARGLPARFQIAPSAQPSDLDDQLAARGYQALAATAVQIVSLTEILQRTKPLRLFPHFEVEVAEEYAEEWLAAYLALEHGDDPHAAARREIFRRITQPSAFATLQIDGRVAAVGLGVLEAGWLGIFCMATHPQFRRQGAASALLRTLAIWAQLYDAKNAYLQVMEENMPAMTLYSRVGFQTLYHYHYREMRGRIMNSE